MSELQNKVEIHMEHIGMVYPADGKEVTALTDVTLDIQKGEFVSLVGPSGCGKTTLLRIIADLLQPTSGVITVGGTSPREARLKRRYGIVFQGAVLYDWRTVQKNVEMPLEIMKVPKADRVKQAKKMLELVNLTEFADHYPKQLSGGMQQRVGIARALAIQPEILLMDEPFDNMSVTARRKMIGILLTLHEKGTSIILNTPMYPEMMGFITDVLVMESGKNLTFGPVEEVYAEALCKSPVRMHILAQMEKALEVLKENPLVDRVTVDGDDVIFRFNGGEKEEAELLTDLVASGALIHNYMRDQADIEEIFRR